MVFPQMVPHARDDFGGTLGSIPRTSKKDLECWVDLQEFRACVNSTADALLFPFIFGLFLDAATRRFGLFDSPAAAWLGRARKARVQEDSHDHHQNTRASPAAGLLAQEDDAFDRHGLYKQCCKWQNTMDKSPPMACRC